MCQAGWGLYFFVCRNSYVYLQFNTNLLQSLYVFLDKMVKLWQFSTFLAAFQELWQQKCEFGTIWDKKCVKMQKLEVEISTFLVVVSGAMVIKNVILALLQKIFSGYPSRISSPKSKSQKHRGGTSKIAFFEKCKNRTKSQKHRGGTSKIAFSKNL